MLENSQGRQYKKTTKSFEKRLQEGNKIFLKKRKTKARIWLRTI